MKIGIGVITVQKRELHPNLLNLIDGPTPVYVHVDAERRGPAYGRNQCIKALYEAGCDYIALFDDDTYPVKTGWQNYLGELMAECEVDVIGYPDPSVATLVATQKTMSYWNNCTGCFTMISRKTVEKIGYYSSAYRTYGYEDIGYLARARYAGLAGRYGSDASPARIAEFIHSEDIYGSDRGFDSFANMTLEEKKASIAANEEAFHQEVFFGDLYHAYAD